MNVVVKRFLELLTKEASQALAGKGYWDWWLMANNLYAASDFKFTLKTIYKPTSSTNSDNLRYG